MGAIVETIFESSLTEPLANAGPAITNLLVQSWTYYLEDIPSLRYGGTRPYCLFSYFSSFGEYCGVHTGSNQDELMGIWPYMFGGNQVVERW